MKLKTYMLRNKITVREMSDKVGVTERSIISYRNGDIPNGRIIKRIVTATGGKVSAIDLIG